VTFADSDVVTVLDDGRIADDLLDATVNVTAAAHPSVTGADMSDDVDLIS
jgi:hypothetical protein